MSQCCLWMLYFVNIMSQDTIYSLNECNKKKQKWRTLPCDVCFFKVKIIVAWNRSYWSSTGFALKKKQTDLITIIRHVFFFMLHRPISIQDISGFSQWELLQCPAYSKHIQICFSCSYLLFGLLFIFVTRGVWTNEVMLTMTHYLPLECLELGQGVHEPYGK